MRSKLALGHSATSKIKKNVETSKVRDGFNNTPLLFVGCMAHGVLSEKVYCEINLEFLCNPPPLWAMGKWPLGPNLRDYLHEYG